MLQAKAIWALGAMSGTSLDGVDAAMIRTDGETIFEFGPSDYRPYTQDERATLRAALGRWPGDDLDAALQVTQDSHIALLSQFQGAEIIGFHGQTLAHDPRGRGTHQLGDGDALAEALNTPVVWDFRSTDVDLGGQGAPLAPFYHFACAKYIGATQPIAFLNLGGVGNLTWVDPSKAKPQDPGALLAFDTGPANAPLNDLVAERLGLDCDKDGALARKGRVEEGALELFLDEPFFRKMPPKSLDRDDFSLMLDLVRELSDADAAATMTAMAATAVMQGMEHCPSLPTRVLVTGGGRKNPVMMRMLSASLDCPVEPIETTGLDGDMLEAQAFAYLAVRVARGLPTSAPKTTGVATPIGGGRISRPT
ncbi:anhydro-N-acetylmuramic acid kinase [Tropicibacter naphthalenivorans]|uniref:Anhydro-N-acetylmuramic acid kinase n=1 Tax=Tropicibacter naphthalenivorans TaxID=441103 RepID=A0A0P1GF02_9RHOB|nr:anhydro-N-acetylmuramic acid kinase [Tropicibacter naphthalenivorans]CUH80229.1 Anhydro-N-acetylmuramic acid kinase [Tropicibacter naphthalenivorans]SMC85593.1 anhydro-N-acetylmuramic acid kinase [Tropicibacter naphthalenivorans]